MQGLLPRHALCVAVRGAPGVCWFWDVAICLPMCGVWLCDEYTITSRPFTFTFTYPVYSPRCVAVTPRYCTSVPRATCRLLAAFPTHAPYSSSAPAPAPAPPPRPRPPPPPIPYTIPHDQNFNQSIKDFLCSSLCLCSNRNRPGEL